MTPVLANKQVTSNGRIIKEMRFARNDLKILASIRDCGFVTARQMHRILPYRGMKALHIKHVYGSLKRLVYMGYLAVSRSVLPGSNLVYFLTADGHAVLEKWGCGLGINADPTTGVAGIPHYIVLNEIMLKIHHAYPVSYWLTDLMVQAENQARRQDGFAKDYDAVTELQVDHHTVTLAIEYEHTLRNRARYREAFSSYVKDPYVQLVVMIVDSEGWIGPIMEASTVPSQRFCLVTRDHFLSHDHSAVRVRRWTEKGLEVASLSAALREAGQIPSTRYPVSFLPPR